MPDRHPRHVFITGGANGIGAGMAKAFSKEGYAVVIADVQPEQGREIVQEIARMGGDAKYLDLDVTNERAVRQTIQSLHRLDVLVNNAGVSPAASLENLNVEDWQLTIDVNLKSVFLLSKYALPLLKQSGSGNIVNISSVNAFSMSPGLPAYAASKGGIIALSRQIAMEYGPQGIRVNSISPGFIMTERTKSVLDDPLENQMTQECYPVGRVGTPEDVAYAALFLASEQASFINGIDLIVDGGMSVQAVSALIKPVLRKRWKPGTMRLETE